MRASQRALRILEEVTVLCQVTKRIEVPAITVPGAWWAKDYDMHRAHWVPGTDHWIIHCGNYSEQYLPSSRLDKVPLSCIDVRWLIGEVMARGTCFLGIDHYEIFKKGLPDEYRSKLVLFTAPKNAKRIRKGIYGEAQESKSDGEIPWAPPS